MPSEAAKEYRISVRMKAGPFDVDEKVESTIRMSELRATKGGEE